MDEGDTGVRGGAGDAMDARLGPSISVVRLLCKGGRWIRCEVVFCSIRGAGILLAQLIVI